MELIQAKDIALNVLEGVKSSTVRCEIAGSIRREKQTVKDVEIVAIVDDYVAFFDSLAKYGRFIKPGTPDVIDWPPKVNAKYIRMLLAGDIKLDIFVANPNNWGSLFCMRTGSATDEFGNVYNGFIPRLFKKWKKVSNGGMMTHGQPTMPDGLMLAVPEEKDFFDLCSVQWIEPCERINGKAIKNL